MEFFIVLIRFFFSYDFYPFRLFILVLDYSLEESVLGNTSRIDAFSGYY